MTSASAGLLGLFLWSDNCTAVVESGRAAVGKVVGARVLALCTRRRENMAAVGMAVVVLRVSDAFGVLMQTTMCLLESSRSESQASE